MKLQTWVQQKFGGTDENALLDERRYPRESLRKDIIKMEHSLKRLEQDMGKFQQSYKRLLEEGARAPEMQRKVLAQKARFEKKKYAIKKKQFRASTVMLGTLLSVQGMREIKSMVDTEIGDLDFKELLDSNPDAQAIQNEIWEEMARFDMTMEDMMAIQDALDIPIMDDGMDMDVGEEETLMAEIAASNLSGEEIEIDMDEESTTESVLDFDVDVDTLEDDLTID